mmetsp:Transcript_28671/g.77298  ORF Transcript_28671/g.77298 Transcript_28671/m.77298 type:complete len:205 (-) Transcript_28671:1026-1640(-)
MRCIRDLLRRLQAGTQWEAAQHFWAVPLEAGAQQWRQFQGAGRHSERHRPSRVHLCRRERGHCCGLRCTHWWCAVLHGRGMLVLVPQSRLALLHCRHLVHVHHPDHDRRRSPWSYCVLQPSAHGGQRLAHAAPVPAGELRDGGAAWGSLQLYAYVAMEDTGIKDNAHTAHSGGGGAARARRRVRLLFCMGCRNMHRPARGLVER